MSEEPDILPAPPDQPPLTAPASPPLPLPAAEREPFWGYGDLALFLGMALPCLFVSWALVKGALSLFHIQNPLRAAEAVAELFVFYALLFLVLRVVFLAQYGRPFWQSLGWRSTRLPVFTTVLLGMGTAIAVALASTLIHTPDTANSMTDMMRDPRSLILMAVFGVTVAPLCEELAFRGFLQPLLVRSLGAAAGIAIAAAAFGLLHFQEYGNSWRHAVVISLAGVAFGCVRHFTGSTKASVIMHASYNGFLFLALFSQRKDLPHLW